MNLLKSKVLIVAHDAGSANLMVHNLANYADESDCLLSGPAIKIFQGSEKKWQLVDAVELDRYEKIYVGTGWENKNYLNILKRCRNRDIKSYAYLDHWTNYTERFRFGSDLMMPKYIITTDTLSEKLARRKFPDTKILLEENKYLVSTIKNIHKIQRTTVPREVLFLGENTQEMYDKKLTKEQYTFKRLMESEFNLERDLIRLRKHPSESVDKYLDVISHLPSANNLIISEAETLESDIAQSCLIYGITSMALHIAKAAEKEVKLVKIAKCGDIVVRNLTRSKFNLNVL